MCRCNEARATTVTSVQCSCDRKSDCSDAAWGGGAIGALVGGCIAGPAGAVIGGLLGAGTANAACEADSNKR